PPPGSTPFPYTTRFRSGPHGRHEGAVVARRRARRAQHDVVTGHERGERGDELGVVLEPQPHVLLRDERGAALAQPEDALVVRGEDRKSTRLNSSHVKIS